MQEKKNKSGNDRSFVIALALVGQVGFLIVIPPVVGAFLGQWLDHALHDTANLATIIGLLLGLAAGITLVVRMVSRLE
jgi:F0F1-type ATP synthase assembly protein I